jgi:Zn-dependent protease with chaperone function
MAQSATPEQELDFAARDAERVLNRAALPGGAYGANEVLQTVVGRLTAAAPDPALTDCRAQLMKGGRPSAFALPNCRVYVTTALFMKLENEAQLAALLARELAHVQLHSAVRQRVMLAKRENDAKSFLVVLAAIGGTTYSGGSAASNSPTVSDATGDLIWRVSVGGYSNELETAADAAGMARFKAAGYAPADAIRALELLSEAAPKDCGCSVPLLASTNHLAARTAALRQITSISSGGASAPSAEYAARAVRLRIEQVQVLISAGDYQDANRVLAEQVAASGESGVTYFLAGEIARRQGAGSRDAAREAYVKGAGFADAPAQLFLNSGLMAREDGQHEVAALAFKEFLRLDPDAVEAALIRDLLAQPPPTPGK